MVGIIVLNYMAWEETVSCVESVRETCSAPYRVYVVDNASPNESLRELELRFGSRENISVIQSSTNRGYNGGNNLGLSQALADGCDPLIVANSDVVFLPGSLEALVECFGCNVQAGIVGPKILDSDGKVSRSAMCQRTGLEEKYLLRTTLRKLVGKDRIADYYCQHKDWSQPFEAYAVSGCCWALSNRAARLLLPLDENAFLYVEEHILAARAVKAGVKTFVCPTAVVVHKHAQSASYIGSQKLIHFVCSEIYYCLTYLETGRFKILPLYLIRTLSYLARMIRDPDYRANVGKYFAVTLRRLRSRTGLG